MTANVVRCACLRRRWHGGSTSKSTLLRKKCWMIKKSNLRRCREKEENEGEGCTSTCTLARTLQHKNKRQRPSDWIFVASGFGWLFYLVLSFFLFASFPYEVRASTSLRLDKVVAFFDVSLLLFCAFILLLSLSLLFNFPAIYFHDFDCFL